MWEIAFTFFIIVILLISVTVGLDILQYYELQRKLRAERERKGEK